MELIAIVVLQEIINYGLGRQCIQMHDDINDLRWNALGEQPRARGFILETVGEIWDRLFAKSETTKGRG